MNLPTADPFSPIAGCLIEPLDAAACERYVAWLLGEPGSAPPGGAAGLSWALAHCDGGVTWGRYDAEAATWRLGHNVAPAVSPPIRRQALQELRVFGQPREVLIWRTDSGLRGRTLRETDPPAGRSDTSDPLRPADESRILRGDQVRATCEHGFTHVADRAGAEQVLPVVVTDDGLQARRARLAVRHYFEPDPESGAVRIAASRLVKLTAEETDDA